MLCPLRGAKVLWVVVDGNDSAHVDVFQLLLVAGVVPVPKIQQAGDELCRVGPRRKHGRWANFTAWLEGI